MKKMMFVVLPIFTMFFLQSNAQSDKYLNGHVVTVSGEVIEGQLKKMSSEKSAIKIKMITADGEKLQLNSSEVKSYVRGDQTYISKKYIRPNSVSEQPRFMLALSDGILKLFKYDYVNREIMRTKNGENVSSLSRPKFVVTTYDYYLEKEGKYALITKGDFKESVMPFIEDNAKLVQAVKKGDYTYNNLKDLVYSYNHDDIHNYGMHDHLESLKPDETTKLKN